jgi:peptidoglycan-N-acetylglucosamine deacetylase
VKKRFGGRILGFGGAAVLIGLLAIVFYQPQPLLKLYLTAQPGMTFFADTKNPVMALTIDDGPHPVATRKILRVLADHHVHATFFLIGERAAANPEIVDEILQQGHEIGNHLLRDEKSIDLMVDRQFEQALQQTDTILRSHVNKRSSSSAQKQHLRWFRPGGGWYNQEMLKIADRHGYQGVLGSVFPYDTVNPPDWFIKQHLLWNLGPGEIMVLHDSGHPISNSQAVSGEWGERTAHVLVELLPAIKERGFRLVTVSELLPVDRGSQGSSTRYSRK